MKGLFFFIGLIINQNCLKASDRVFNDGNFLKDCDSIRGLTTNQKFLQPSDSLITNQSFLKISDKFFDENTIVNNEDIKSLTEQKKFSDTSNKNMAVETISTASDSIHSLQKQSISQELYDKLVKKLYELCKENAKQAQHITQANEMFCQQQKLIGQQWATIQYQQQKIQDLERFQKQWNKLNSDNIQLQRENEILNKQYCQTQQSLECQIKTKTQQNNYLIQENKTLTEEKNQLLVFYKELTNKNNQLYLIILSLSFFFQKDQNTYQQYFNFFNKIKFFFEQNFPDIIMDDKIKKLKDNYIFTMKIDELIMDDRNIPMIIDTGTTMDIPRKTINLDDKTEINFDSLIIDGSINIPEIFLKIFSNFDCYVSQIILLDKIFTIHAHQLNYEILETQWEETKKELEDTKEELEQSKETINFLQHELKKK